MIGTSSRFIPVELLDLLKLAHRKTWVARPLSVLKPRLLCDVIHHALVGRVRENLAAAGVEADVGLHRVRDREGPRVDLAAAGT